MPLASGFMNAPADLSPKLLAASGIITSDENLREQRKPSENYGHDKLKRAHQLRKFYGIFTVFRKKKVESLEHCWGNNFESFRQPSGRKQILPKYLFGCPCCHLWSFAVS